MASSQRAYRNPEASDSENFSRAPGVHWKAFFALIDESTLHPCLGRTLKAVLEASGMGPDLWAATKTIAGRAHFCYRTVQRHIDELERRHLLKLKHEANKFVQGYGFRHTATYVIHPEAQKRLGRCRRMTRADWDRLKKIDPHPEPPKTERRIYFVFPVRGQKAHAQSQIQSAPAVIEREEEKISVASPAIAASPPESPPESPPKIAGKLTRREQDALYRLVMDSIVPMKKDSQFLPAELRSPLAEQRWHRVLSVIESKLDRHQFDTWLRPTAGSHSANGTLYVRVPKPEFLYVRQKYGELIEAAVAFLNLEYKRVEFFAVKADAKEMSAMSIIPAVLKACKQLSTPRRTIAVEDAIVALRLKGMKIEEGEK